MSWDLHRNNAKWSGSSWSINVDLAAGTTHTWLKLHDSARRDLLSLSICPKELQEASSALAIPFGEAYVRQRDLIAMYPEHAPGRFGYQIDTRILREGHGCKLGKEAIGIEIWLSIQTSLLDSHPQMQLSWHGAPFHQFNEFCWTGATSQLGLIVHPLDKSDCEITSSSNGLTMNVFGRFMEKGVIRRMRFVVIASHGIGTGWILAR